MRLCVWFVQQYMGLDYWCNHATVSVLNIGGISNPLGPPPSLMGLDHRITNPIEKDRISLTHIRKTLFQNI